MINARQNSTFLIHFIIFAALSLSLLQFRCDPTEPDTDSISPIEIVLPETDIALESYNPVIVVARYDKTKIGSIIEWNYSKDNGKTWKQMSLSKASLKTTDKTDDENIGYSAHVWTPEDDTLSNTHILIKVYDYDNTSNFDKKGPYEIL